MIDPTVPTEGRRPRWMGIVAAVVVGMLTIVLQADLAEPTPTLLGVVALLALVWHRRRPATVAVAVAAASVVALLVAPGTILAVILADLAMVGLIALEWRKGAGWWALPFALLPAVMNYRGLLEAGSATPGQALGASAVMVLVTAGAWVLGRWQRDRRNHTAERIRSLERERDQAEQLARLSERTRISREMHDVVAHAVSGLVALADGGRYAAVRDPAAAMTALEEVSRAGRTTLGDLRAVIATLRDPDAASTMPTPNLDDLDDLVETVSCRGTPVDLTVIGNPAPVAAGVGSAAYRVIQESLTNVVKHAGPGARARVTVTWGDDLVLEVADDGTADTPTSNPPGTGLVGMRERVEGLSGTLDAGTQPTGWIVTATLPRDQDDM